MNTFFIRIQPLKPAFDPLSQSVFNQLKEIDSSESAVQVSTERLYSLEGELSKDESKYIVTNLLQDPVTESGKISEENSSKNGKKQSKEEGWAIDVWPKPGVTDPVGETVEKGILDLGIRGKVHARSGIRYIFRKSKNRGAAVELANKSLANQLIHDIIIRNLQEI